jgi:hypothetical protein
MIGEKETDSTESLDAESRGTQGINIGGNTVTQATEHLKEEQRLLVRWLHTHARNNKWDWTDLVKAVGYSSTTWYRIWTDKYRYPKLERAADGTQAPGKHAGERMSIDDHCQAIEKCKRLAESRETIQHASFIETSVWNRVDWVCQRSFVRQKIGFIYGESQIGKSTCLKEFKRRNNHGQTAYVELPPSAGVQLMTREIALALHVSSKTCFEKLITDVIDALDGSKLLIIDEVHRVFTTYQKSSVMRCLDVLRYIHDKTQCGMVLCGTNVFRDQLKQGEFFQYLKQLRRRGLNEVQLPAVPPEEDLKLMARHFGLDPDEHAEIPLEFLDKAGKTVKQTYNSAKVVDEIAKADGFGKYVIRLQDAVEMAAKKRQPVSWKHFVRAHHIIEAMGRGEV